MCLVEFHAFGIYQGAWDIILYDFGFLFYLFAFRAALCIIASLPCTSLHHVDFAHKAAWMAFPSFPKKISGLFRIIWYHPQLSMLFKQCKKPIQTYPNHLNAVNLGILGGR